MNKITKIGIVCLLLVCAVFATIATTSTIKVTVNKDVDIDKQVATETATKEAGSTTADCIVQYGKEGCERQIINTHIHAFNTEMRKITVSRDIARIDEAMVALRDLNAKYIESG